MNNSPLLFAGSSHVNLANEVCKYLNTSLGKMHLGQFPDGETEVQILENVQGRDVFVLQSIARQPNHYLMELLIIIDALKRDSPRSITAIIPYFGYCRQDRRNKPGVPITAKLVANLLVISGVTRLITCDLHAAQLEGFFEIPVDHLQTQVLLFDEVKKIIGRECVVVSPDTGSVKIAENMAKLYDCDLAIVIKKRISSSSVTGVLIGNVDNKNVLICDDICSTAGTLIAAANLCHQNGSKKIVVAVTHALFNDESIERIKSSVIKDLIVTNTIEQQSFFTTIKSISIAPMIAKSVSSCLIK